MTFKISRLRVTGSVATAAEINFEKNPLLIRGPSDTGKSYIFQCISYCLGSGSPPEMIPEAAGYDRVWLEVSTNLNDKYTIVRGLVGGGTAIFSGCIEDYDPSKTEKSVDLDINDFVRFLSDVEHRVIVKKTGKKGAITAGALRHWILLSQTDIVLRSSVLGQVVNQTERASTLCVLMTGKDDAAIEVGFSAEEKTRAAGGAEAIEEVIKSLMTSVTNLSAKPELVAALERVDTTIAGLSNQRRSRAGSIAQVRHTLAETADSLRMAERKYSQSSGMLARFSLLDRKYISDLQRLMGLNEGVGVFELMPATPCPLCNTPIENQIDPALIQSEAAIRQRQAFESEAKKITLLRAGLLSTIHAESIIKEGLEQEILVLRARFDLLSAQERNEIGSGIDEFEFSITTLANRRSELFSEIKSIEEIERLRREAVRLEELSRTKSAPINRALIADGNAIAGKVLDLLHAWGFDEIKTVSLNTSKFDMQIDGRTRTSFGQGTRALFLAAYFIALLEYCTENDRPHPGILVIDSPLKNYSDVRDDSDPIVSLTTVRNRFYAWMAAWQGKGQLVIMENDPPLASSKLHIQAFSKKHDEGRYGFFPPL